MIRRDDFEKLLTELETTADAYWNISRDNALFLSLLIKSTRTNRVLEVGTSNGYSTLWFARALVESGVPNPRVVTLEADAGRAALARKNFRRAGLDSIITLMEGDALANIPAADGPFEFVFLDAEKSQYADYMRLALPHVPSGGLIIGDDTVSLRDQMPEYITLAFSHPDLETVDVPIDDGIVLSRVR
jgi:predicted O-methyltransferase YrrM